MESTTASNVPPSSSSNLHNRTSFKSSSESNNGAGNHTNIEKIEDKGFLGTGMPIFNGEHTPPNIALISAGCGLVLGIGFMIGLFFSEEGWSGFGFFLAMVACFHFFEYLSTAMFHPDTVELNSFLFNHSPSFNIAMISSLIEYLIEWRYFPWLKQYGNITRIGLIITIFSQILRTTAMVTASSNFTHAIRDHKEQNHTLVKKGVYSILRHPSYTGFFYWGIGVQIMSCNPICLIAYAIALWKFFSERITYEEYLLTRFFGREYIEYKKVTVTAIPFIS